MHGLLQLHQLPQLPQLLPPLVSLLVVDLVSYLHLIMVVNMSNKWDENRKISKSNALLDDTIFFTILLR